MVLPVAQAARSAVTASRLMARGRPRAWAWMARTASSENRVSDRPGVLEVAADVPAGFGWGERGRGDVVAELHALVEGGHVAGAAPAPQGGLADEQDGQRRPGIEVMAGEHADRLQLVAGEQL